MNAKLRLGLALATWLSVLGIIGWSVSAADPAIPAEGKPGDLLCPTSLADAQFATAACASCHNADPASPQEHPFARKYRSHEFILLSEGRTWERHDPHSLAYKALESNLGKQMSVALQYDVTKATQCLTCHAVDKLAGDSLHVDATKTEASKRFATTEGVACVGCHGVKREWQAQHYEEPNANAVIPWRGWPATEKAKYGLRDLRDATVKARLCASCHVGSAELGREVTHDMYAAGHPPLPPFELATFLKGQPAHWAHPTKLKYFASVKAEERWGKFHFHPDELSAAREVAVGAIAAARAEAGLLRADAERAMNKPQAGTGLDFARFDCVACHHDLKYPSYRQKRAQEGPPGRPPLRASVRYLAEAVTSHAMGAEPKLLGAGFGEKWSALRKAATDKPFGDIPAVKATAADVQKWCDEYLAAQSATPKVPYSQQVARELRTRIAEAATGIADPEAAMVLAWAYLALSDKPLSAAAVKEFAEVLPLSVRAPHVPTAREPSPIDFASRQKKVNAFNADRFAEVFKHLQQVKE